MVLQKGCWHEVQEYAASSDIGLRRESNQDALNISLAADVEKWRQQGNVYVVADGMGAHAAGELASKLAVEYIPTLFFKYLGLGPVESLRRAFQETNHEVYRRGQANPDFFNMGTTASALVLVPEGALIGHVGDSRVYRLRGNQFTQWTRDHSVVWELRERPEWVANGLLANVPKNWITKSIGPAELLEPDVTGPMPVEVGDTFLLCTDGLTGRATDEEIAAVVGNYPPLSAVKILIDLANLRGGQDNITVLIVRVMQNLASESIERAATFPVDVKAEGTRRELPTHWITGSVLLGGAVVFFILKLFIAGYVLSAGAAAVALWGFVRRWRARRRARHPASQTLAGPFATVAAPDAAKAVELLLDAARQARREARQVGWEEDVPSLDDMESHVETAVRGRRFREALDAVAELLHELAERQRVFFKRSY